MICCSPLKSYAKKSFTVGENYFSIKSYSNLNIPICIPLSLHEKIVNHVSSALSIYMDMLFPYKCETEVMTRSCKSNLNKRMSRQNVDNQQTWLLNRKWKQNISLAYPMLTKFNIGYWVLKKMAQAWNFVWVKKKHLAEIILFFFKTMAESL